MIRCAKKEDTEKLFHLYKDFVMDMNRYDDDDCNMDDEIVIWIENALSNNQSKIFLEEKEGTITGFVRVQMKQREEENVIHYTKISDLYVIPEARRTGIAGSLIESSKQWAKMNDASEIVLNVYEQNKGARNLYGKYGFWDDEKISLGRIRMKQALDEIEILSSTEGNS